MTITVTDRMSAPTYSNSALNRFLISLIREERDLVLLRLSLGMLLLFGSMMAALVWRFNWPLLVVYMALNFWLVPPVILMLHNTMHRPFFKSALITRLNAVLMSFIFGIPTGYTEHHIGMHHAENNVGRDLSATYHFTRDSFFDWLKYYARFMLFSEIELTMYFLRKKRADMAVWAIGTEIIHYTLVGFMCWVDLRIGLICFALPVLICRTAMMIGNWGQHAFIDATQPANSLVNSITCINSNYNQRCFNDGYHIGHHVKPNRHWTELPGDFLANIDQYAKAGCIVFKEVDFFMVSILLFLGRYDVLAKKFVPLDGKERTQEEIIAFLKSRTRPVTYETSMAEASAAASA